MMLRFLSNGCYQIYYAAARNRVVIVCAGHFKDDSRPETDCNLMCLENEIEYDGESYCMVRREHNFSTNGTRKLT